MSLYVCAINHRLQGEIYEMWWNYKSHCWVLTILDKFIDRYSTPFSNTQDFHQLSIHKNYQLQWSKDANASSISEQTFSSMRSIGFLFAIIPTLTNFLKRKDHQWTYNCFSKLEGVQAPLADPLLSSLSCYEGNSFFQCLSFFFN